ncbi:hypothetical protein [Nonomuraea sp. NPDC049709]|uniref:hypothetical protein n=1 Tax=Nonomuraea sp. NPDC049709 TaxID=3154736 RepID=UPI003425889B
MDFRGGIDLDRQRLPEGAGHLVLRDAAHVLDRALRDVERWADAEDRDEALATAAGHLPGPLCALTAPPIVAPIVALSGQDARRVADDAGGCRPGGWPAWILNWKHSSRCSPRLT